MLCLEIDYMEKFGNMKRKYFEHFLRVFKEYRNEFLREDDRIFEEELLKAKKKQKMKAKRA
jgi:hypothetical protein